jgi:FkbM family methyltransferase
LYLKDLNKALQGTIKYFGIVTGAKLIFKEVIRRFLGLPYNFDGIKVNSIQKYLFVKTLGLLHFYGCHVMMGESSELATIKCSDGTIWIVRSEVESFKTDVINGPLLYIVIEPIEWNLISQILKEGSTFIDVGAYIGGYTVRALLKGARVIALEPEPTNFKILSMNVEANGLLDNAVLLNIAAGREEGVGTLTRKLLLSSLLRKTSNDNSVEVPICTLDKVITSILSKNCIVDVLKIDVEGSELDVIEGATQTLKRTRFLLIELWRSSRYKVLKILRNLDFEIMKVVERPEEPDWCNFLLCNRTLYKLNRKMS